MSFSYINSAALREIESNDANHDLLNPTSPTDDIETISLLNDDTMYHKDLIEMHQSIINLMPNRNSFIIRQLLRTYEKLLTIGALQFFSYDDANPREYSANGYFVTWNNRSKLTDIPARVIILDGTANINPEYNQDFIAVEPCDSHKRKLENLYIHIVNVPTGKGRMLEEKRLKSINKKSTLWKGIVRHIKDQGYQEEPVVFTYKDCEQIFNNSKKEDRSLSGHFGAIKGRNDYVDYHLFAQVGIFQAPEYYYLARYLELHPELLEPLKGNGFINSTEIIDAFSTIQESDAYKEYKTGLLLVDLEQNIFRSSIRDPNSTETVTYFIFANTSYYELLIRLLQERFGNYYGAHVLPIEEFSKDLKQAIGIEPKEKRLSHVQMFWNWLNDQRAEGHDTFTLKKFMKDTGLSDKQIKRIKRNEKVSSYLKQNKISGHNLYTIK